MYHYAGNNPIKYIDPTGCDDLYYGEAGNYLKTESSDTTNVYLSNNGSDTLVGSQSDFETMTAALYGETDNSNYSLEFWRVHKDYKRIMGAPDFAR